MFEKLFFIILRTIAIPYVIFLLLKETALGEESALLAVCIALTITVGISVIPQLISLLPKLMLLRGNKLFFTILTIGIELASVMGFWYYYFSQYNQ